jgi:hypothetical protein
MHIKFCKFNILLLLAACVSLPRYADAQSIGGTIFGLVKDPTGPVPQAEVRITNIATGQSRFWLTDDQGRYELREVPPGFYELKVAKDGYRTFSTPPSKSLHLTLAQAASVEDITLSVAPVEETRVEVKAVDVAMTNSNTPTLGTAFDENQVHALPFSARDVNNLGPLAPGVVSASTFNVANTLVAFAVNGSRGRDNNFIIDSVDNNDPLFGGAATQFTNNEVFDEFHILTGQFQAEYGRNSGSIVNVVTKQGGRDFHGSVLWVGQNDGANAMTKVEKQSGLIKPARFYENQLGATLSGPIKRNSAWFFLSYQWDRSRNDLSSEYPVVSTLPTPQGLAMLQAINAGNPDFGKPSPSLAALLNDPLVNKIPTLSIPCNIPSPKSQSALEPASVLNALNPCTTGFALIDISPSLIPTGTYLIPEVNVTDLRDHEAFARIDQQVGVRNNFFFRYFFDDFRTPLAPSDSPAEIGLFYDGLLPEWRTILAERPQNFGSAWTHSSTSALNELRFAYSRVSSTTGALNSPTQDTPAITISHLTGLSPATGVPGNGQDITLGRDSQPARFNNNVYQLQENYSFVHGIHSLKFGANLNVTISDLNEVSGDLGQYFYQLGDTFENAAASASLRFGNLGGRGGQVLPLREIAQFYFAQDDLRVSSNLTINIGLRYENYSSAFNAVVDRSASSSSSPPRIDRINTNFAPRLGFAWGLGQRTVIRGGYGIFYNPTFLDIALLAWQSSPISPFFLTGLNVANPLGEPFFFPLTNQYPKPPFVGNESNGPDNPVTCQEAFLQPGSIGATPADCATQNTVSSNLRNPFVHDASLGIQRQVSRDFAMEASYFGSRGTRLFQRLDINPASVTAGSSCGGVCLPIRPDPNRGIITEVNNGAFSIYNALQLSGTKRFRGGSFWDGLSLSSAYTWSHMIDNASEVFGSGILQRLSPPSASGPGNFGALEATEPIDDPTPFSQNPANTRDGEKGNSSFDHRHRFTLDFVWTLPTPSGKTRALLGNWQVAGVFTAQSGQPFSPLNSSGTNSGCSVPGVTGPLSYQRPNIGNPQAPENTVALLNNLACADPHSADPEIAQLALNDPIVPGAGPYIDPSGKTVDPSTVRFVQVGFGEFGNAGRNILTGPASANLDAALSKSISLGERVKVKLTAQAFDVLNRQNPGPFAGNPFIASAQPVSSTVFDPIGAVATPARVSGLTPENSIDAGFQRMTVATTGVTFLNNHYLTTSSRRVEWSVRFSF